MGRPSHRDRANAGGPRLYRRSRLRPLEGIGACGARIGSGGSHWRCARPGSTRRTRRGQDLADAHLVDRAATGERRRFGPFAGRGPATRSSARSDRGDDPRGPSVRPRPAHRRAAARRSGGHRGSPRTLFAYRRVKSVCRQLNPCYEARWYCVSKGGRCSGRGRDSDRRSASRGRTRPDYGPGQMVRRHPRLRLSGQRRDRRRHPDSFQRAARAWPAKRTRGREITCVPIRLDRGFQAERIISIDLTRPCRRRSARPLNLSIGRTGGTCRKRPVSSSRWRSNGSIAYVVTAFSGVRTIPAAIFSFTWRRSARPRSANWSRGGAAGADRAKRQGADRGRFEARGLAAD